MEEPAEGHSQGRADSKSRQERAGKRHRRTPAGIMRWIFTFSAWTYASALLLYWMALHFVGERWWLTTLVLYMPHAALLVPIAALTPLIAFLGPRRLLLLQIVSSAIVVFPIMGLKVGGPTAPTPGAPRLRVLSYNVYAQSHASQKLAAEIVGAQPDVILLQWSTPVINDAVLSRLPKFAARASMQFLIASRYPIVSVYAPPELTVHGVTTRPRFVGATLETPLGKLAVYSVHPISPHDALETVRDDGVSAGLHRGWMFDIDRARLTENTRLRRIQAETIAGIAGTSSHPVIIAGDTNLPGHSQILAETIGQWSDGFTSVGRGFGYTFPMRPWGPWMRIDRILAGPELRFIEFGVACGRGSYHRCVWADLERVR